MKNPTFACAALALGLAALAAPLTAQPVVLVNSNIAVSTTWTSANIYDLQQQIYVLPGATLTIEAGTIVASTANVGGSLAVTKGGKIFVRGTRTKPVIMTSTADRATWVGGNPRTGTWREAANEWGNLTIMGDAYISEDAVVGNTAYPNPCNVAPMEGLIAQVGFESRVLYGGGNDDDDSGSISYLSLRYTGRVIGLGNELNGLSLGGVGRETDIHHVEIMNNVDDGIEVWGGKVNLKYFSIWNIGDDSFDVDQGWRGKAQFGLIVQGYSLNAAQGSGVGDNCFETDGAENSHYQPVTTATIYNCTVIGQPIDGDHGTAWRDNARVQYRKCIFMNLGERAVAFDNIDGDGGSGYGFAGTLSWADTWTTSYTATSTINASGAPTCTPSGPVTPSTPAALYTAQSSGTLAEITDSIFFSNLNASAYTEANNRAVFAPANNNVLNPATMPITAITRGPNVVRGGKVMQPVISLDPRPAGDALTAVGVTPNDGFFCPSNFRGAFAPGTNWLCGWTATEAFGMTTTSTLPIVSLSQSGPGGLLTISNCGLITGAETFNAFTINDPCPAGIGSGPLLGLCANLPTTFQFLVDQLLTPLSPANFFHFPAPGAITEWPGLPIPAGLTIEGVCLQVNPMNGMVLSGPVERITTQ